MSSWRDGSDRPDGARGQPSVDDIRSWLVARIASRVHVTPEQIDTREPFTSYGIPSKEAVALSGMLEEWLGRQVAATAIWEYPTIELLAAHLANEAAEPEAGQGRKRQTNGEPVALIGIGCRFPGASSPGAFWRLLTEGRDAITEVPVDRWAVDRLYDPDPATPGTLATRWGGFLDNVEHFDAAFFGIAPREASRMDPQQRLVLEVAWEALEDAGQPIEKLAGTKTGVFVGISTNDYGRRQFSHPTLIDAYAGTGNALSIAANRVSYQFDFLGPSIALDTACSSSLVAVHMACRSLWSGEATLALAGGVNLILSPDIAINFTKAGVMAPDGRCKTFDARANGYVRGEGAGMVVLKPLSQALADGDQIYAVILGSAVNNDGRTNGLMAPSRQAQEAVLRDAYACAGISPALIQYVEAHGTGTLLGDPIEAKALGSALAVNRPPGSRCAIGSVKTNIGHLEAAAGVAGLVKVALALKHGAIPPSLHFETPNPHIPFADLPLRVQQTLGEWPVQNEQRIAGISSFGFGGTNAHVVLQDAPATATQRDAGEGQSDGVHVLPLSARSPEALQAMARTFRDFLSGDAANVSLRDICYTAAVRRSHHQYRLAVTGRTGGEVVERLEASLSNEAHAAASRGRAPSGARQQIVFVFPGQGSQWVGMGRQLLEQEPVFRAALDDCDRALREHVDWSLVAQLTTPDESSRQNDIDVVQPALFGIQVALATLWRSWGIEPAAVVGHSMGEVAAAHVAGALTLQDAARIICERSRLLRTVSGHGGMAVVDLPIDAASRAAAAFCEHVSIAVENSPTSTVLSGDTLALETLIGTLERQEIFCRLVNVDVASHSPQVDPLLDELREQLARLRPRIATIPFHSTVTGQASNGVDLDGDYWVRNLREPVLFSSCVQRLLAGGCDTFLEISPHPILLGALHQGIQSSAREAHVLPSLRRSEDERGVMLGSLSTLYTLGHNVKWNHVFPGGNRPVVLPPYPWQRERCWFEIGDSTPSSFLDVRSGSHEEDRARHPLLGTYLTCADDSKSHYWEMELSPQSLPYVTDHRVREQAVFPGTAYVEMALAAGIEVFGQSCLLSDVEFRNALFLHDTREVRTVQLVVSEGAGDESSFRIYSRPLSEAAKRAWTLHATGKIRPDDNASTSPQPIAVDVRAIQVACVEEIPGEQFYSDLQASGLHYGPCFQGIERVWKGPQEAVGLIRVPASLQTDVESYGLHPAVLDAALQVVGATLPTPSDHNGGRELYLPVRIGEVRMLDRPGAPLWSVASSRVDTDASHRTISDVRLLDGSGQVVVEVRALELQRLRQEARGRTTEVDTWFYERRWELKPRTDDDRRSHVAPMSGRGHWIIFADAGEVAQRLASLIEAQGDSYTVVRPGAAYTAASDGAYEIDPGDPSHARQLLTDILRPDHRPCRGVVHLWNLDYGDSKTLDLAGLESAQLRGCTSVLHLIQAVSDSRTAPAPRLFLVTRHAQCVGADVQSISVAQSPVWGLARTIAQEHPEVRCTSVDLGEASSAELELLHDELTGADDEDQIAFRDDLRYVARMTGVSDDELAPRTPHPFRLELSNVGVIDRLAARRLSRRPPRTGEVEIEVAAAGVNFMDVMRTLGLVPSPDGAPLWAGAECVGHIVALGDGVDEVRAGDEVIAIAPGSFASFAMTSSALVARKPDHLSIEEAATIPVAFLTAYYALHHVARLRRGERVLIHAAAGGVGLAAVQIARWKGAEVFGTAGSPEKRQYLQSLGLEHVFDSRSLGFGDDVMAGTSGEGVDVVLNSLSGEFAARSLSLLRRRGRFLEIGKRDIHENRPLHLRPFEKNLAFFAIDLQQMCAERPALVGSMLRRLMRRFEDRTLRPLPFHVFAMSKAADALRFMAQARHTGKVVLSMPERGASAPAAEAPSPLRSDATYLITGGLGGLGLTVAAWMVEHGAGHLVLIGRSRASAAAEEAITRMRQSGANVSVFETDVTDRDQVANLLNTIASNMPPLRGVVHAAGVLDDGVLVQLDSARLASVARPKVNGAWNLHTLTLDTPLDFFVLFSSAASVLGSPGQGNYAAANAFLDALAHHRRVNGLPALSINWGPWGEIGLAARRGRADRLAMSGIDTISPANGVEIFGRLLTSRRRAQVSVVPIDWDRLDARAAMLPILARFTGDGRTTRTTTGQHADTNLRDAILRAAAGDRSRLVQAFIREQLASVLGLRSSSIDIRRPLNTLGVDSLMAIEFKNRVERELAVTLPIATLLRAPDVLQLADLLVDQLSAHGSAEISEVPRAEAWPTIVPDPASRHVPFPLNDIQGAYWVGRSASLELGKVGSHFYLEFEGEGVDIERLSGAWAEVIGRHDMLRAVVRADGQQEILATVPAYAIGVSDVRRGAAGEVAAQVAAVRERMAQQVYDPGRWPLFEVRATRLPGERVRVHVSIDLLMADVWSLFILFREWGARYREPAGHLAPLTLSFRDYVLAEAALQTTPRYERAQAYWTARLPALPPGPELPLARPPGSVTQPRFVRRSGRVDAAAWQRIKARARHTGLTPSMVLCTAFAEVLAAWSKAPQFTLNVTLFHRLPLHAEVPAVVGDFTSTVLLAVDGGGGGSFVDRARRLQQQLWTDLEHREVSGVRVLRDLARRAGRGPRVAMPVVFTSTLGQEDGGTAAPTEWLGELVYGISQTPQVWLDHQVGEAGEALLFNWDAVEALFPEGLLDAMFAAYCTRVTRLGTDEATWAARAAALIPEPEVRLQAAMNATATPLAAVTLPALVAAQVAERPAHPAVTTPTRELTYAELGAAAAAVARWLRQHGAQPNRLVAVVMDTGWEQVVAVVGVVQAGAAYLPIEADGPAERLALLLAQGETPLVLTQSWLRDTLAWPPGLTLLAVDQLDPSAAEPDGAAVGPAPQRDDLAYVIFTSGSTGVPKGVMVTHRAVVNTLLDINRRWAVGPADRVLALSALSFDLSVYDIFGTLAAGGTVVLPSAAARRDPTHWLTRLAQAQVTVWNTVPALMQLLVETAEATGTPLPAALRLVLLSGDWIPVRLPDRIRAAAPGAQVISLGGATEAAIWSIAYPVGAVNPAWPSIPYGRPLANQTWHVLHADGTPCPVWVPGELYIGGVGVAQGYWQDPVRTRERFVPHPQTGDRLYRTGDWGRYRPDGDLEFLGRDDLQVKVQGYRIELGEIEAALARHPAVEQAVVAAHGDRTGDKRLVAYVVGRGTPPPDAAVLRTALQATLPPYMVPTTFHLLPALPLTANGKVDRNALASSGATGDEADAGSGRTFVAPRDDLERQLTAIWEDVLGVGPIGVTDRFFDLGGNSFLAVRLMVRVRQSLGRALPVSMLFQADDVGSLARAIREHQLPATTTLVRLAQGREPAFFCVHPIGGNVMCYVELAQCFRETRAFYGIQARGLQGEFAAFSDIATMASHYLEQIRAVQPRGPYLLGGWSMGGTVAFEIAQQLKAQGEVTARLVLIDTETTAVANSIGRAVREPDLANPIPADVDPGQIRHLLEVFTNNDRALSAYREQTYWGAVTLFRAHDQPVGRGHDLGWNDIVVDGVDVHVVPGDHYTILQRPNVDGLAAQLGRCLEAAGV